MIEQRRAEAAATACAVCVIEAMKEERLASAVLWYSIGEDYAGASTWEEKKAFHALVAAAMDKYSNPAQNASPKPLSRF